jgi:hypothetical protein
MLYYDTGKPLTEQDKVDSLSSTTLFILSHSRVIPTKTKNHTEREFEERLLILGEFNTVSFRDDCLVFLSRGREFNDKFGDHVLRYKDSARRLDRRMI